MRRKPFWSVFGVLVAIQWGCVSGESPPGSVIELGQSNFYETVAAWPAEHGVLMEFYAHWCPACKRFQPEYERVAAYFNSEPRVTPIVTVARVDCANEVWLL
jgi:thioredoxin-like negative regulator of GroEL